MPKFKLLYMNQGGGGHHGAIKYSNYELVLLAESAIEKMGFSLKWESQDSLPIMSVQSATSAGRLVIAPKDLGSVDKDEFEFIDSNWGFRNSHTMYKQMRFQ